MNNFTTITKENAEDVVYYGSWALYLFAMPETITSTSSQPNEIVVKYRNMYMELRENVAFAKQLLGGL